jgi:hypothetical protein
MNEPAGMSANDREDVLRARNRVVDHWKRLFAIVSGFAITVACLRVYSCALSGDLTGMFQFVALVATIPPVFHGMERSLDLRYLQPRSPIPGAARMMGDTAVLMVTGLFFLGLALSIPDYGQTWLAGKKDVLQRWYIWLLVSFFVFDFIVLLATRGRLREAGVQSAHTRLAVLNLVAGLAILVAVRLDSMLWSLALIAIVRSVIDYNMAKDLLYPQASLPA